MPSLVVPFRGAKGKSRLGSLLPEAREAIAEAMLDDVLAACVAVGPTFVVGPEGTDPRQATFVRDPGGGQGAAVRAGLDAAALASPGTGPLLVVNADLPCVTPRDLLALAGAVPDQGLALASAADGTTNALALSAAGQFVPTYGPGSADRFAALAPSRRVDAPNLIDDVDTVADLERLRPRLGPRTRSVLTSLRLGAAA
ncbi:MAG TPA: NTP transferase domain-containing protein [Gaiellaceae bacterium]|jgi:2-phospho-L-lactate guanylyltransferase|nr:NTP transferase domain-containing protein [Gaiellaceae bacterium]